MSNYNILYCVNLQAASPNAQLANLWAVLNVMEQQLVIPWHVTVSFFTHILLPKLATAIGFQLILVNYAYFVVDYCPIKWNDWSCIESFCLSLLLIVKPLCLLLWHLRSTYEALKQAIKQVIKKQVRPIFFSAKYLNKCSPISIYRGLFFIQYQLWQFVELFTISLNW